MGKIGQSYVFSRGSVTTLNSKWRHILRKKSKILSFFFCLIYIESWLLGQNQILIYIYIAVVNICTTFGQFNVRGGVENYGIQNKTTLFSRSKIKYAQGNIQSSRDFDHHIYFHSQIIFTLLNNGYYLQQS